MRFRCEADADLQHRRVADVEHASVVEPRGEGGGVEDHVGRTAQQPRAQRREDGRILEARHIKRVDGEALAAQRRRQRLIGRGVAGEPGRAIEYDQRERPVFAGGEFAERGLRRRRRDLDRSAERALHEAQSLRGVLRPALLEIGPQPPQVFSGSVEAASSRASSRASPGRIASCAPLARTLRAISSTP